MRVGIVDTDIANIGSVRRAVAELGGEPVVARDPAMLEGCSLAILPGVGSFSAGMARLDETGFTPALRAWARAGRPLLGICLGMQLLARRGSEGGDREGLGLIEGEIVHLRDLGCSARLPHMGWNTVSMLRADPLVAGLEDGADFYFVHSYAFAMADPADVIGVCEHDVPFPAIIGRGSVAGAQFHPEKSSGAGFAILRNFLRGG